MTEYIAGSYIEDGIVYNHVCTDEEYLEQGFLPEEINDIRRHDVLFNNRLFLTDEEKAEMYALVDKLML